jgi:hypothetical protein
VLYGRTAIALRIGHRRSVDLGFFTDVPLEPLALDQGMPELRAARTLRRSPDILVLALPADGGEVNVSFCGNLRIRRIGKPERAGNGVLLASPLDLLATSSRRFMIVSRPRITSTSRRCCAADWT